MLLDKAVLLNKVHREVDDISCHWAVSTKCQHQSVICIQEHRKRFTYVLVQLSVNDNMVCVTPVHIYLYMPCAASVIVKSHVHYASSSWWPVMFTTFVEVLNLWITVWCLSTICLQPLVVLSIVFRKCDRVLSWLKLLVALISKFIWYICSCSCRSDCSLFATILSDYSYFQKLIYFAWVDLKWNSSLRSSWTYSRNYYSGICRARWSVKPDFGTSQVKILVVSSYLPVSKLWLAAEHSRKLCSRNLSVSIYNLCSSELKRPWSWVCSWTKLYCWICCHFRIISNCNVSVACY